jgi:hypothetical protein
MRKSKLDKVYGLLFDEEKIDLIIEAGKREDREEIKRLIVGIKEEELSENKTDRKKYLKDLFFKASPEEQRNYIHALRGILQYEGV